MDHLAELQKAVETQHTCTAHFAQSVPVREMSGGNVVWEGVVHVFNIDGCAHATTAYAWSSAIEGSTKRRFYTVLGKPPINSAADAVRAAIVAESKK